ncbi:MAG: YicC family protein [Pirellulales bacterium]|nr:YicC family protein [Pirellulales bacterium]
MTGYGEAHSQQDGLTVAVEIRTINSRYFKLTVRCGDTYSALEQEIEEAVRQQIKRGTIQVTLRVDRPRSPDEFKISAVALASYRAQLEALHEQWRIAEPINLESLLALPGVVEEGQVRTTDTSEIWPLVKSTLEGAIQHLTEMRQREGAAMASDLLANVDAIEIELGRIEIRAPLVAEGYRARLEERMKRSLAELGVTLEPSDLIKEISIFGERSDISEEIVRLKSHLEQFRASTKTNESAGRRLEFLTQEMFRETNTIGSKANDVEIARHVIEIKTYIERIREMIQNVE